MPIMTGCCCFHSLESGSRASSVFSAATAIANIIIDIWMLVNLHWLDRELEPHEKEIWLPPGIIPFIYIELVVNLVLLALSLLLWVGINNTYDGKKMVHSWIYGIIGSRVFHLFLGIYVLVWIGGHRVSDVVYVCPEAIVVSMYWMLNCFVMIAALLCVVSYWQDLMDEVHGKEKRIRYYHKLANIRSAARGDGTATPMSSYFGLSRSALNISAAPSQAQSMQRGYPPPGGQYAQPQRFQGRQQQGPPPQQQGYGPPRHQGPPRHPPQHQQQQQQQQYQYPPHQQGPPPQRGPQQGYGPPPGAQQYYQPQQHRYAAPPPQGRPQQGYMPPQGPPQQQGYVPQQRPQGLPPHMQRRY